MSDLGCTATREVAIVPRTMRGRFDAATRAVAGALDSNEFLVGGRFTVADVLIGSVMSWPARAGFADILSDSMKEYVERLSQRPAYQRADARMSG